MKKFWVILNISLISLLGLTILSVAFLYRKSLSIEIEGAGMQKAMAAAEAPGEPVNIDLESALKFRIKGNSRCAHEAVLMEPGEPFRFSLRPVIDLPGNAPTDVVTYVETHPDLEEKTRMEWKTGGKGEVKSIGDGRYEFTPPQGGGDVTLSFRGSLKVSTGKGTNAVLSGESHIPLVCPTRWEDIPPKHQEMIGRYPNSKEHKDFYKRPAWWYVITESNQNWRISPHYCIGDFDLHFSYTTPQSPELNQFPQYIALNPNLVLKLEAIWDGLAEKGFKTDTLGILAGYRSPGYNQWKKTQGGVGGKYTKGLSTHMYGAAADFYVDLNGDGIMDDMNGDGKIDQDDAAWVRNEVVDAVDCQGQIDNPGLVGACGIYGEHDVPDRSPQTPNLHVDVRGFATPRWFINKHDAMITDWQHWQKHPCPNAAPPAADAPPASETHGADE